jgi:hypothetical protein
MESEKKYYLYHKISPLELNYLGITQRNPFKYRGSGIYWKKHLKAHNIRTNQIKTIILIETSEIDLLIEMSKYFSELYNIVNSSDWANLTPESGDNSILGYKFSDESKKRMSESRKGKLIGNKNPMFGKPVSQETKFKISKSNIGKKRTDLTKSKISDKLIGNKNSLGHKHSTESREKISSSNRGKHNIQKSDEEKNKMSERQSGRVNINYNSTPILQFDLNNHLIKEWFDLFSLLGSGFTKRQKKEISRACRGKIKSYLGFIWKFKN